MFLLTRSSVPPAAAAGIQDLSFAKGDRIRVTAAAPKEEDEEEDEDDEEDVWLIGEALDGSKSGTFPAGHIQAAATTQNEAATQAPGLSEVPDPAGNNASGSDAIEATGAGVKEPTATPAAPAALEDTTSKTDHAPETISEEKKLEEVDKKVEAAAAAAAADPQQDVAPAAKEPVAAQGTPSKAVSSAPERKMSSPPPAAPKPSGLAARIAAFNKPAEGPPPLPRGKPGGWKKPAPSAPTSTKPAAPLSAGLGNSTHPAAPIASASPTSEDLTSESQKEKTNSGFSAADAQSSIKMSLKERMAALQRGEQREPAAEQKPRTTTKPPPGRIDEEKRSAAMASLASEQAAPKSEDASPSLERQPTDGSMASEKESSTEPAAANNDVSTEPESLKAAANDAELDAASSKPEGDASAAEASAPAEEDKTDEDRESERRAAIAKRMAALGGRRMGGGPSIFGAPAPSPKAQSQDAGEGKEANNVTHAPEALSGDSLKSPKQAEDEPVEAGQTLAVPRRTAPPRKKKSASTSSTQSSADPFRKSSQEPEGPADGVSTEKIGIEEPKDEARLATAAVVGAGTGSVLTDEERMTEEPIASEAGQQAESVEVDAPPTSSNKAPSLVEPPQQGDATGVGKDKEGSKEPEIDDDYMKVGVPSSQGTDTFEPSTPVSQTELDEHTRQLEAFVNPDEQDEETRSEDVEDKTSAIAGGETLQNQSRKDSVDDAAPAPERSAVASPPPPSGAPPRPPSARPPVPKTSLVPANDEGVERLSSPPPTRAPPVPQSSRRQASIDEASEKGGSPEEGTSFGTGAATVAGGVAAAGATIAAPKARMAVPAEVSDDEGENEERVQHKPENTEPLPAEEPETMEGQDEEADEEQLRRRRLADRMARMGAQPIMGAPMPFKKRTMPQEAMPEETGAAKAEGEGRGQTPGSPPSDAVTGVGSAMRGAPPAPTALGSPPPVPTQSPPPPTRAESMSKRRSASSAGASDDGGGSLNRQSSIRARPPVPMTQAFVASEEDGNEDDRGASTTTEPVEARMASPPPRAPMSPPPRPPMSPAPRAPMRAPPTRESSVSTGNDGGVEVAGEPAQAAAETPAATTRLCPVESSAPSSRDLDLMPSSQWWRHGLPVKLPPTLQRPDAAASVSTETDGRWHLTRVDLIFEDYSSTVITVLYQDDDADEEHTKLTQQHRFSPGRPSMQQLQEWSQRYSSMIARQANALLAAKDSGPALGDGTSRGFISALVSLATNEACLPSVGSSFGAIILAQAGTTPVDTGADEIRPGDVVALHGADLKGKRGLTPYHATYGSANDPTFACVIEADSSSTSKKRKLRCLLVAASGSGSAATSRPEEVSIRLDDVRSGLLRVFRVAPRQGWLPN